ncbi:MAG: DUF1569 domain-containing protein [Leptospiraceae bacterium]|nr:DUF1569 domain-containing protein [Leptospiraceae bacterium]MCP5512543.1 DUF1569 domain-containing protein [Leptospiraceae bacterium]
MKFHSLEETEDYLESLKKRTLVSTGKWSPDQIFSHISDSIEFLFSDSEGAYRFPEVIQATVGRVLFWKMILQGKMDNGLPNPIKSGDPIAKSLEIELDRLLSLTKRFNYSVGPFNRHPVFGKLTKDEWVQLHLIHCENHFSYLKIY